MKKIIIFLLFIISIINFSEDFNFNIEDSNKKVSEKNGEKLFSLEIRDFGVKKGEKAEEVGKLNLEYYDNGVMEVTFFKDSRTNLIKIEKEYKKIISKELNEFLKVFDMCKIDELKNIEVKYYEFKFARNNNEMRSNKWLFIVDKNKDFEEYKKRNNGREPKSVGIESKYPIKYKNQIIFDVTYKNENFIMSYDEKEYKNEEVRKFIVFIKDFIEKIRRENTLYIDNSIIPF